MRNILGISLKLIGRYGGLTGITWFKGVGKKSSCLEQEGEIDHLHACISVHITNQSMLNNVNKASQHEYKIAPNKTLANQYSFKAYESCNHMYLYNQLQYPNPKTFNASNLI
jgi:hypothetical protein